MAARWHRIGMDTLTRSEVFERYGVELTRFATSLVGPSDAQDVVSDAMLRAMWSRGWDRVVNQRAYLYRSVLSQARMHHRSDVRRHMRETEAARVTVPAVFMPEFDVWDALDRLEVAERAVVFLVYWEDLTESQIAERLEISERTVRRRLTRARRTLGRWLDA